MSQVSSLVFPGDCENNLHYSFFSAVSPPVASIDE